MLGVATPVLAIGTGGTHRCNRETINVLSFGDFETAGRAVLALLHRRFGFELWMLTRTEGDDWIVLHSEDHGYGVAHGFNEEKRSR